MGKSISHTLFKMYILLLYILKSRSMKKNCKTSPSHPIFIFHAFSFSLVELHKLISVKLFLLVIQSMYVWKWIGWFYRSKIFLLTIASELSWDPWDCIPWFQMYLYLPTECVIATIIAPAWCVSPACCSPCGLLWMNTIAQLTFPLFLKAKLS